MPSPMAMKNGVPPSAQSKPKVAAMCIQSLRYSGAIITIKPDAANSKPSMRKGVLGTNDGSVGSDADSDTI